MDTFLQGMGLTAVMVITIFFTANMFIWSQHECHTITSEEQVIPDFKIEVINGVKDTTFVYTIK